jgi:hypothetical protein
MAKRKLTKKEHLYLAAHQVAVELCLMHELKKPLTGVCAIIEHDKLVFKLIWDCKIEPLVESGTLEGRLAFPDQETKDTLFFVFEQVGSEPEPVAEAAEGPEEPEEVGEDILQPVDNTAQLPTEPFFGYRKTKDMGFLSISLSDPVTKFAVRYPLSVCPEFVNFANPDCHMCSSSRGFLKSPGTTSRTLSSAPFRL